MSKGLIKLIIIVVVIALIVFGIHVFNNFMKYENNKDIQEVYSAMNTSNTEINYEYYSGLDKIGYNQYAEKYYPKIIDNIGTLDKRFNKLRVSANRKALKNNLPNYISEYKNMYEYVSISYSQLDSEELMNAHYYIKQYLLNMALASDNLVRAFMSDSTEWAISSDEFYIKALECSSKYSLEMNKLLNKEGG